MSPERKIKATTVDEYLASVSDEHRIALERLRETIRAVAPDAQECISYDIPTFRIDGRMLVAYGAAAHHCAFYPGAHPIEMHKDELTAYTTGKGTIRFQPACPLPDSLVRKLVKTRIAQRCGTIRGDFAGERFSHSDTDEP